MDSSRSRAPASSLAASLCVVAARCRGRGGASACQRGATPHNAVVHPTSSFALPCPTQDLTAASLQIVFSRGPPALLHAPNQNALCTVSQQHKHALTCR